jgi:predicted nucleic acid-binding protein
MKSIVFDAGPIISLATNNLLFILPMMKEKFGGKFYIPEAVKKEVVDKPLMTKKFKFEAIQVLKLIEDGVIEVVHDKSIHHKAIEILQMTNNSFKAKGHWITAIQFGEAEGMAATIALGADAFVVDERTNRMLLEDPNALTDLWQKTLHTQVRVNKINLIKFRKMTRRIRSIRSVELVTVAYELGILDEFILKIPKPRHTLLEGLLWGVKLNGCAVSKREIDKIIKLEFKKQ